MTSYTRKKFPAHGSPQPSYAELDTILDHREKRKILNNTWLEKHSNAIHVVLHGHTVVIVNSDDTYRIDSCGYMTVTTMDRIARFSPVATFRRNWVWYISARWPNCGSGLCIQFRDGFTCDRLGNEI